MLESSAKVNHGLALIEENKELSGTLLVLAAEVPVQLLDVGPSGVDMQESWLQNPQWSRKNSEIPKLLQKQGCNFLTQTKPSAVSEQRGGL